MPTAEQLERCKDLYRHLTNTSTSEEFEPSQGFLNHLNARGLVWGELSAAQRESAFADYFLPAASSVLAAPGFAAAQDASLGRALERHGVAIGKEGARRRLEELSEENRKRLEAGATYTSTEGMRDAEAVVANLELRFDHNTNSSGPAEGTPLLSSRQLEDLGVGGGANTEPFGRDFMRGDDQIYFWADFRPKQAEQAAGAKPDNYGDNILRVSPDHARKVGWISIYVMYPNSIRKFASEQYPQLFAQIDATKPDRIFAWKEDALFAQHADKLATIRDGLHRFDFTVDDFSAAVKGQMLSQLDKLRTSNKSEFDRMLKKLRSTSRDDQYEAFRLLVAEPWKIPLSAFEMKIPIAIPDTALTFRRSKP